jgi:hypothetical protein
MLRKSGARKGKNCMCIVEQIKKKVLSWYVLALIRALLFSKNDFKKEMQE